MGGCVLPSQKTARCRNRTRATSPHGSRATLRENGDDDTYFKQPSQRLSAFHLLILQSGKPTQAFTPFLVALQLTDEELGCHNLGRIETRSRVEQLYSRLPLNAGQVSKVPGHQIVDLME